MNRLNSECVILSLHEHPSVMTEDLEQFVAYERQGRTGTSKSSRSAKRPGSHQAKAIRGGWAVCHSTLS
jgi:hypothetical protein